MSDSAQEQAHIDPSDPARYAFLTRIRLEDPGAVARAARRRVPFTGFREGRQVFVIAADHPARGALDANGRAGVMADRRSLLDRLRIALSVPGCEGILASPDVLDDLLLLGALDGKLVFGSINRGGLSGAPYGFDDTRTGYTPEAIADAGFEGGKMLVRIPTDDPIAPSFLRSVAETVDGLSRRGKIAMLEPFLAHWEAGAATNLLDPDSVIRSVAISQALGASSAHTWMKIPVVDDMERVMAATTLPTVLLGGGERSALGDLYERWGRALSLPGVIGLTVGRSLLYPDGDDVAAAVRGAVGLLRRQG